MSDLTAKQKSLIKKWIKEKEPTQKEKMLFDKINPMSKVEDLSDEQWNQLIDINDMEILYQTVNHFMNELTFSKN